jgi:hypothetical protein
MADISMCTNEGCPLSGGCYRQQATPNEVWQSYAMFSYTRVEDKVYCASYIPITNRNKGE